MSFGPEPNLRVLIVSGQPIARAGMAAVLRPFRSRVKVVGEVGGVDTAPAEAARAEAQIVLFDTRLDSPNGLDQVGQLAAALGGRRVVVMARRDEARFIWLALQRGAAGFLLDTIAGSDLVEALGEVSRGTIAVDPTLAGGPRLDQDDGLSPRWPGAHLGLTEKQSQVLELMASGQPTAAVSRQLGMSATEVKAQVRSACRRLHARDRADALARLAREGLFSSRND